MQDMRVLIDKAATPDDPPGKVCLISHKVFLTSLCTSELPHESVNLFFVLVVEKDKLTGLWGSCPLQNDLENTLCGQGRHAQRLF